MKKYFYTEGTVKHGPFSLAELQDKNITPSTLIWYDGLKDWTRARDLEELSALLASTPPPVPGDISNPGMRETPPPSPKPQRNVMYEERPTPRPKNWLVESILCTVFCCMPFGIAGIVYAAKVDSYYNNGDYRAAQQASDDAKKWTMVSLWLGLGFVVIYFIFMVMGIGLGGF
jgi:hypothetical protein